MVFLALFSRDSVINKWNCEPAYNPPGLDSQGSKHQWGMDCMVFGHPEVPAQIYPLHVSAHPTEVRWQGRTVGKGQSR